MTKKHENADLLIIILSCFSLAAGFLYAARLPYNESGKIFGVNYNLAAYVALLGAVFLLFLVLRAAAHLLPASRGEMHPLPGFLLSLIYALSAAAVTLLVFYIYKNENNIYPENTTADYLRQMVPHRWYFLVVLIISALLFFTAKLRDISQNIPRRAAAGAVFALLCAFVTYSASPFFDQGGGSYHVHAVTNTIVNVARGIPFSDYNMSIYGHYALIFYPFVKLFGNNYEAIAISVSLFTFAAFAAAFYAAAKLIRRDDIYFLTAAAITATATVLTRRGQYYQINPLRLITPSLVLALLAFAFSPHAAPGSASPSAHSRAAGENAQGDTARSGTHHSGIALILSVILGTLSVIWNLETGIFAVLTIAATRIFISLKENRFFSLATLKSILLEALYCALCGGAAFALTGLYNLAAGGGFGTIRQFIYPLMSGTYSVSHLRIALPSAPCLYIFEIMLFFAAILIAILRRPFASDEAVFPVKEDAKASPSAEGSPSPAKAAAENGTAPAAKFPGQAAVSTGNSRSGESTGRLAVIFASGLSGLLSLIYFINRPAYGNLAISTVQMAILLGVFSEAAFSFSRKDIRKILRVPQRFGRALLSGVLFVILVFTGMEGMLYTGISLMNRVQPGSWTRGGFETAESWIESTVPEDAAACGFMLPEIYFDMGRDPHIALTDWSDMNRENLAFAEKELEKYDHVLISTNPQAAPLLPENEDYRLAARCTCGDTTFLYYERK